MFQSPAGTNQTPPAGQPGNSQGQPPDVSPVAAPGDGQSGAGAQGTPQYATVEDVQKIVDMAVSRLGQSVKDSTTAKIQKLMATLQEQGIQVTEQAAAKMVSESAQAPAPAGPSAPAPSAGPVDQPAAAGEQQLDPVSADAFRILRGSGIDPMSVVPNDPNDPDNKLIPWETESPSQFLDGVRAYAQAKANRSQKEGDPARGIPPASGTLQPAWKGMDSLDKLSFAYKNQQP